MKLLTSISKLLVVAVMLVSGSTLFADDASAQLKIGFADAELVLVNIPEYQQIGVRVQQYVNSGQQELQAMVAEFQDDYAKFEKQAALLPPEKRTEKETELNQRYVSIQQLGADKDREVAEMEAELLNPLIERVGKTVDEVAKEKGLDIVLKAPGILYINPDTIVDITADVAVRLGIDVQDEEGS
ncbi:MAG: OmpH family outer membrane protein [Rhodothermales bacterium]|nr:OmpH family outer membrane protein [Rhodothermales bacterium]